MDKPLTDKEFDRLADFLADIGIAAMNVEMLDGFFVALISGPDMVMPGEYLPQIWGEDFSFDSDEQAIEILDLLMRHWNDIAAQLLRGMNDPQHIYMPLLLQDEAGIARGNDWAKGYMRGVQMRPGSWRELIGSEERGGSMIIIMLLAHEHDPDPELRSPAIADDNREELIVALAASLNQIYRYFEPHRRELASAPMPIRRTEPKVGRNERCPCGSGRKFKHCCAFSSASH